MPSDNWPDDRLDEFSEDIRDDIRGIRLDMRTGAEATTYLSLELNTLKAEVKHIKDAMADRATSKLSWWAILATFSNSLTAVVVYLISRGK